MEHALVAPSDGEVAEIAAEAGAQVAEGARLIVLNGVTAQPANPFARPATRWLIWAMALHLLKLCVGCNSIADLVEWIEENRLHHRRLKRPYEQTHTTRMVPKRADEIVGGGSLFWVIKGQIACRQKLLDIEPFIDKEGIGRCRLHPRTDGRAGGAASLPALPGLALSRAEGCPPGHRPPLGGDRPDAGGDAPPPRRARPDLRGRDACPLRPCRRPPPRRLRGGCGLQASGGRSPRGQGAAVAGMRVREFRQAVR